MNPKFRVVYLLGGGLLLALLIVQFIVSFPAFYPEKVLLITIPDMVFFYLAYKTYPEESDVRERRANNEIYTNRQT